MLDPSILEGLCTTEQMRILLWVQFFAEYGQRLDADQIKSYTLDMCDSDAGIYPPEKESLSSIDVYA